MKKLILSAFAVLSAMAWCMPTSAIDTQHMSIAGYWRFQLDPMGFGKTPGSELYLKQLTEGIHLPGSTDEGGKGIKNVVEHVDRLSRKFEYCGQAWYQRDVVIPESWRGQDISLSLERCHWEVTVYVDGEETGSDERLSTPNRFNLTKQLTPGNHTITLCVDNRLKYPMDQWTHGTTEYTQTNWNGVVGKLQLTARPNGHADNLQIYPDVKSKSIKVKFDLGSKDNAADERLLLVVDEKGGKRCVTKQIDIKASDRKDGMELTLPLGKSIRLWDEFSPSLYECKAIWQGENGNDTIAVTFGMRQLEQGDHHVRLNGRNIHLRGTLDCCVFPLTGYPATDKASWTRIMRTVKSYGLNHVRFHSWCPPEAAFDAADEVGVYLQVELPMWIKDVGQYPARRNFFEHEMYAILNEYGNHPSFLLYCNGNENEGDFAVLEDLIVKGRKHDSRHLYSASTARTHVASDQFYASHVAARVGDGHSQWITVYEGQPSTDWDRNKESDIDVPVIAHETGQRCMYPNFDEMNKYTGVLEPRNFKVYRERLAANGMLSQAGDFFRATGAHTVLQYKEVNESLLRTSTSGGFQLLGLSDFPGQGCAFVGVLDAFWDSKGLVSPEKYRESCAPVVVSARLPKRTFYNDESLTAQYQIYQFGPKDIGKGQIEWQLVGSDGSIVKRGRVAHGAFATGAVYTVPGKLQIPLTGIQHAGKYTLKASIAGGVHNEWNVWVYPKTEAIDSEMQSLITTSWTEAKQKLSRGENVLFVPAKPVGRKTHFAGHFWNPIMFKWNPMIVGTLIADHNPAMSGFPTGNYADWQWWDVLNNTTAADLTDMRNLTPVIQSVDTYEYNRKLGIAFETKVGAGKLFVLQINLSGDKANLPAVRQLLRSVGGYVKSAKFAPSSVLHAYQLDALYGNDEEARTSAVTKSKAAEQLLNK